MHHGGDDPEGGAEEGVRAGVEGRPGPGQDRAAGAVRGRPRRAAGLRGELLQSAALLPPPDHLLHQEEGAPLAPVRRELVLVCFAL